MSECPNVEVRELLPDLINDRLGASARLAVDTHVATCGSCAEELAMLRAVKSGLARAPLVDVGRITKALPSAPRSSVLARHWRIAAALAVIAAGAATVPFALRPRRTAESPAASVSSRERAVAVGGPAEYELAVSEGTGELSDADLRTLADDVEALEAVPDPEPEVALPVLQLEEAS